MQTTSFITELVNNIITLDKLLGQIWKIIEFKKDGESKYEESTNAETQFTTVKDEDLWKGINSLMTNLQSTISEISKELTSYILYGICYSLNILPKIYFLSFFFGMLYFIMIKMFFAGMF